MTEKRYYAHKHLLEDNKVHDKICHNFMNIDETVEHMNNQYWKYKQLKEENEQLKSRVEYLERKIDRERTSYQKQHEKWEEEIQKENEQLQTQLSQLAKVNREGVEKVQSLAKENEQLKLELATYKEGNETLKATLDKVRNNG